MPRIADKQFTERLFAKAEKLIEEGRISQVSEYLFYVIGFHGKYFVAVTEGNIRCNCAGFQRRGVCSHVTAVLLYLLREDYKEKLSEALRKRIKQNLELIRRGEIPSS
ncbi:MAG: hypothetical protein DRJ52_09405 [Thermoprotei archaeon]|nr:MAG: hypothetical protein DRJ52_09405 [Thermoprotei archaeon]RLF00727.1 MAG: hypothetical protein DRJ63_01635 [Thermoprotei archaeon]HDI75520.1 hypothetical protein [Thermoprotei archaeon]